MNQYYMDDLAESNQSIVRSWAAKLGFEYDEIPYDLDWVDEFSDDIVEIIEDFDNLETKARHYTALLSVMRLYEHPDLKVIEELVDEIKSYLFDADLDNELKPLERVNWVHWDEVKEARDEYLNH